ncbi:WBP1 [Lepeophtheirus salmonis]|uniref:Dolichyl-diphosphooligosaccharide--protein glycosyltransferase 48 kDa subunit n=1 Tax=Lepeophtheirus salmonis TaxID=72036 RepID=A0A7R8HD98_LEPSM|nr:WBP1 [Lepeophtheirus salmonis]CAF3029989.1 WBP1 [Lepeophtheirus salmonis]
MPVNGEKMDEKRRHRVNSEGVRPVIEVSNVESGSLLVFWGSWGFAMDLSDLGLDLTYKTSDDSSIVLKKYGEFLFDHLVLMSPNGKDVFVGGVESSDLLREFASECGFEVDEDGSMVLDHIHYDSVKDEEGLHTVVVAEPGKHLIKSAPIVGSAVGDKPLLYKGVGILADANPLVLPILSSSSYAYSYNPNKPIKEVIFSGSLDFFSNDYFESSVHSRGAESPSGNRDLAKALVSWCFKESGLLRTSQLKHHLVGQTESPPFYTVTEDVEYSIVIEEFKGGKWVPYSAKDVQLEFVRIDPFVRINLKPDGNGKFSAKFKIPDVYGFSVRPLRHDQYERFILSAYPYYASAFSMMFGVFVFGFVFLHHKEASPKTKSE